MQNSGFIAGAVFSLILAALPQARADALPERIERLEHIVKLLTRHVRALESALTTKQETIASLEEQLATVQSNSVLHLDNYLTLDFQNGQPVAVFEGLNVQILNGVGRTDSINGLGNLIVGYDELRILPKAEIAQDLPPKSRFIPRCSEGVYDNMEDCLSNGQTWDFNHKSGSHNLIVGAEHAYSRFGAVVFGFGNSSNRDYANVTAGFENVASGVYSNVVGGLLNATAGDFSTVTGGSENLAAGFQSSVSAGIDNIASGNYSHVSGGRANFALGTFSTVTGGFENFANGEASTIHGGSGNNTGSNSSSILGGMNKRTVADFETVPRQQ